MPNQIQARSPLWMKRRSVLFGRITPVISVTHCFSGYFIASLSLQISTSHTLIYWKMFGMESGNPHQSVVLPNDYVTNLSPLTWINLLLQSMEECMGTMD